MWPATSLSKLLNIHLPIIQAPMAGGISSTALVSAVSNAGGLGSLGAAYLSAAQLKKDIQIIKQQTNHPFSVNLFIPQHHQATPEQIQTMIKVMEELFPGNQIPIEAIHAPYIPSFEEQFNVILEEKVPIFTFTFGKLEDKYIHLCKKSNIKLIGTATSLQEALELENQGIDAIVVQGSEAGGHRGTFQNNIHNPIYSLHTLLEQIVNQVNIPLIAAGGIMEGNGIVKALKQGADGVQMGTAFICCEESIALPIYKNTLLSSTQDHTRLSRAFSGRLARVLTNQFTEKMQPFESHVLPFPIQNAVTTIIRNKAKEQKNAELMSLYAGTGHYLCKSIPAAKLIEQLHQQVMALL